MIKTRYLLLVSSLTLLACTQEISSPEATSDVASALDLPPQADDHAVAATADLVCNGPPGLYVSGSCKVLADGVLPYEPAYWLWSDGADKERFVYLPSGTTIDTSNPDRWAFPVGTRFYKTFSRDGVRLETRVIEKVAPTTGVGSWTFASYAWHDDQRNVNLAPAGGVQDVLGTTHDIPSVAQCRSCHSPAPTGLDAVNGFGGIQLNHPGSGVTLHTLLREGLLAQDNLTLENSVIPGDALTQEALGYLHANCANCHSGPNPRAGMSLLAQVGVTQPSDEPAFKTAVCKALAVWRGRVNDEGQPYTLRIAAGHSETSAIVRRMHLRVKGEQMPPIGTEVPDAVGVETVSNWIDSLPPDQCGAGS